jgi:hypothetical protein
VTRRAFASLPGLALAAPSANFRPGEGVQRTLRDLAAGRSARIVVYGQSITQQNWWKTVVGDLSRRFPNAGCRVVNLAIGGYSTQFLIRTIEHDIYPVYPGLVIFHDYGRDDQFEQMIRDMRSRTTAEVLILNDHVTWHPQFDSPDPDKAQRQSREDKRSFETLPAIARKYGCGLCDIRGAWYRHLEANSLKASDLLRDNVHLNESGCDVYARVVNDYLIADAALPADSGPARHTLAWKGNRASLDFDGNRVVCEPFEASGAAIVRIDGKRPAEFPSLYAITRPSNTWCVDWPSINRIDAKAPLAIEDWVLRCFETEPDGSKVRFHVIGSETGFDGEGTNTEPFVSRSGRVVIQPEDWVFQRAYNLRKIPMPRPFEVQWRVKPLFQDVLAPSRQPAVIASGLANSHHRMELLWTGEGRPPALHAQVFRPPHGLRL